MAAQRANIVAGNGLDGFARRDGPVHDVVQLPDQFPPGVVQARVLRRELVDGRGDAFFTFADLREDQILLGMMQHIGIVRHVEHDVQHQIVIGRLAAVEEHELPVEHVEQPGEVDVLRVPQGKGGWHGTFRETGIPTAQRGERPKTRCYDRTHGERSARATTLDPDQNQGGLRTS